jgi:hypothetical protein
VRRYGHTVRRALVLAVLLCLGASAAAQADRWPAWVIDRAIATADAHWPDSPCRGAHEVAWLRGQDFDQVFAKYDAGTDVLARSQRNGCHVWVAWDRVRVNPVWLCTLLEHEFGHTAGLDDSLDVMNVMFGQLWRAAPDCKAAFRSRGYRLQWHW